MQVSKSTDEDLHDLLTWLEAEHTRDGAGFWCNREVISHAHSSGELFVVRNGRSVQGFQVGLHSSDILCVRQDCKRQGIGRALFEASLARAEEDGCIALKVECNPRTSLPFWQSLGFERFGDMSDWGKLEARRIVHKRFELSPDTEKSNILITVFPEAALYSDEAVQPIALHSVVAEKVSEDSLQLDRRVIILKEPKYGDLVVRIECDGMELCFEKVKHVEALGLQSDPKFIGYFTDEIFLNKI